MFFFSGLVPNLNKSFQTWINHNCSGMLHLSYHCGRAVNSIATVLFGLQWWPWGQLSPHRVLMMSWRIFSSICQTMTGVWSWPPYRKQILRWGLLNSKQWLCVPSASGCPASFVAMGMSILNACVKLAPLREWQVIYDDYGLPYGAALTGEKKRLASVRCLKQFYLRHRLPL